jgi:hypothetical protein
MGILYGRAGRLTAENAGLRPGQCTLLGALKDPSTGCAAGSGTLVAKLPGARGCAERWEEVGEASPAVVGAPPVLPAARCE